MNTPNLSGEKKIAEILKKNNIKYETKKKLILHKDSKKYRIPDFYLPDYKLAIEYFGSWHNEKSKKMEKKERARFMEKVGAYEESGIDCVYLYPQDLEKAEEKILKKIELIETHNKAGEIARHIVTKKVVETEKIETREPIIIRKEKPIFGEETKKINYHSSNSEYEVLNSELLKKLIVGLGITAVLLFLAQTIIGVILFVMGNPLTSELHFPNDIMFTLFAIIIPLSIILSGIYAYKKNLSKGFIYVAIILFIFYIITLFFFGDPLNRAIVLLVGMLAIIPAEYYMVTSN